MDDLLDIEKLNAFLHSEANSEQENPLTEFENFIEDDSEEDGEPSEDEISKEIQNDLKAAEERHVKERLHNIAEACSDAPTCVKTLLPSLNEEEQEIINSCEDTQLKELMILNRTQNVQCIKTLNKIIEALNTTRRLIWHEKRRLKKTEKLWKTSTWKLGHPYFKTTDSFACPINMDVKRKRSNNELMKFKSPVRWTDADKEELKKQVELEYLRISEVNTIKQIALLRKQERTSADYEEKSRIERNIEELENELSSCADQKHMQPAVDCEGFDWDRISQNLNSKHAAVECEAFWKMFLNPSINKSSWSEPEDSQIKELVEKYQYQNWDAIASELNTRRSAFSVCVHYYSKLSNKFLRERFCPEEDEHLLEVIESCRVGSYISWPKVAQHFQNRSKQQLYHRYKYYLSVSKETIKTRFSVEEDALILCLVHRFGKNFSKISNLMPTRSLMQIKNRYTCYLENLLLYRGPWREEEDRKILRYAVEHGVGNWGRLSKILNRSRGNIRHRFYVLRRWLRNNPGQELINVPRKRTHEKFYILHQEHTKYLFEKFKNRKKIPTLQMLTAELGTRLRSWKRVTDVDRTHGQLIDFFKSSYKMPIKKDTAITDSKHTAKLIYDLTQLLAANLEIPPEEQLKNDSNLDEVDLELLKHMRGFQECRSSNSNIQFLVPPNLSTIIGLRSLIFRNSIEKEPPIIEVDDDGGNEQECKLFEQRLFSLFHWPSILSLHPPPNTPANKQLIIEKPKRSVGRPPGFVKKNMSKIELMACMKRKNQQPDMEQGPEFPVPKTPTIKVRTFANVSNLPTRESLSRKCKDKREDLVQPSTSSVNTEVYRITDDGTQVVPVIPNPQPKKVVPVKTNYTRPVMVDITHAEIDQMLGIRRPPKRKQNEEQPTFNKDKILRVYSAKRRNQNIKNEEINNTVMPEVKYLPELNLENCTVSDYKVMESTRNENESNQPADIKPIVPNSDDNQLLKVVKIEVKKPQEVRSEATNLEFVSVNKSNMKKLMVERQGTSFNLVHKDGKFISLSQGVNFDSNRKNNVKPVRTYTSKRKVEEENVDKQLFSRTIRNESSEIESLRRDISILDSIVESEASSSSSKVYIMEID